MWITKILSITRIDKHNVICDIEILTGRTHQIRYHLSHYWLPIIGDYLYGKKDDKPLWLCAYRLIFEDPDGEVCDIKITSSQEKIGTKSST
jgi:23S rRNA-/tRNA-specific pseudouridylate synthase